MNPGDILLSGTLAAATAVADEAQEHVKNPARVRAEYIVPRVAFLRVGGDDDWAVGQVGDAPDAQLILEAPPILSATIEPTPSRGLRLLWREDVTAGARVSISWTGRDWFDVQRRDDVRLKDDENPTALNVRGEKDRTWVVLVVNAAVTKNTFIYSISTYPSVPFTRMHCPSWISRVACSTPTTAGKPYSRAITAPWVISPPTSVTRPFMDTNKGVQLGSVNAVTNISPSSRSASSRFKMTRPAPLSRPKKQADRQSLPPGDFPVCTRR